MINLHDASKFATAPEYAEARGACWGTAVFIATILALGTIAVLSAGLDLHTIFSST
jgi:hypothetical protein